MEVAMATTIRVNGIDRTVDVDGDTPLLWVLRDVLGMTGTKFGCGMALCGACTVHVDGAPTRSCVTPIDSIGPSEITTIEAIGASRDQPASNRWRYRRRDVRQHLPLRDLCPYSRSDQASSAIERKGRLIMILDHTTSRNTGSRRSSSEDGLSRRGFLQAGAAAGGGLMLNLSLPFANGGAEAADGFVPNAFIRIEPDGQI